LLKAAKVIEVKVEAMVEAMVEVMERVSNYILTLLKK